MYNNLNIIDQDYQHKLSKWLLVANLILMLGTISSLVFYLWAFDLKTVQYQFIKVDPSGLIERIADENEIQGDQILIQNYLKAYVKIREEEWPNAKNIQKKQNLVVQAYSNHSVFSTFEYRKPSQHLKKIEIQKIEQLDPELYQVQYQNTEKKLQTSWIATLGVRLLDQFNQTDSRQNVPNLLTVNPLKIEIFRYNKAEIISKKPIMKSPKNPIQK